MLVLPDGRVAFVDFGIFGELTPRQSQLLRAYVANLMMAQAAVRAREMALRISIGAGRWRLIQMVLLESTMLSLPSAALGALFAWWSAPFVVGRISPADNPARLILAADWRIFAFGITDLALQVALF